jgi:DNA invertase Pin-like site-specific DNA recombinase
LTEYDLSPWMKKAQPFVYLRLSTEYQAEGDAGKPLAKQSWAIDQLAAIAEYLKKNGLKAPKEKYVFRDLASGGDMNREGLKAMLEAVMNHKGRAYIAIVEPSRWSRNTTRGNAVYAPLYERDIPLLSTSDGLMSGTATEPRPNAQFLFTIKQGVSEGERGQMQERTQRKISTRKKAGILSGTVGSVFPFARQDPLDLLNENLALLNIPWQKGGGGAALGRLIAAGSAPHGAGDTWYVREMKKEAARKAALSPEEYAQWYAYRKRFRALQKQRDYDSGNDVPVVSLNRKDTDFGMRAVQRLSNGYLKAPQDPDYSMPSEELIADALANPREYLSDADKKLYRKLVSKR